MSNQLSWFKLNVHDIESPKVSSLSDKAFRVYILLQALMTKYGNHDTGDLNLSREELTYLLRQNYEEQFQELQAAQLITASMGEIRFRNWKQDQHYRNPKSHR